MRIKFVDKAIKLYKRITGRFEPITSKCVHDNILQLRTVGILYYIIGCAALNVLCVTFAKPANSD